MAKNENENKESERCNFKKVLKQLLISEPSCQTTPRLTKMYAVMRAEFLNSGVIKSTHNFPAIQSTANLREFIL